MKTAILIHGMPSKEEFFNEAKPAPSNSHWFPWLQKQLLINGNLAQTPEMPEPYEPDYEKWSSVLKQFKIDADTILVGHSSGAGFLVRWLSENEINVGKVVLVAPWIDPNHTFAPKMFDGLKIDGDMAQRTQGITVFISQDDDKEELDTVDVLKSNITGLKVKEFTDKGHFTFNDMKTEQFPELLEELLK